jgi:hypothetical protein
LASVVVPARAFALAALALGGCAVWDGDELLSLQHRFRTITTGPDGYATVRIPRDEVAFTKVLVASSDVEGVRTVYVDRVATDDGTVMRRFLADLDIGEWRTGAVSDQQVNHFNWPISDDEPDIGGEHLRVVLCAVNPDRTLAPGAQLLVETLQATDDDFFRGTLGVNLIYAGGTADDPEVVAAFTDAAERMRAIFADTGLEVELFSESWPDGDLPRPGFGSPAAWTELTTSTDNLAIDVVVAYGIAGSEADVLGAAGSIPGGLIGSARSGVILSATANAGPDLRFSDGEVDLLAGTMGHEIGHMLGLFHPVELSYDRWDALLDTERCTTEAGCQGALGRNLMYPSALCSQSGCLTQTDITANQVSVLHRYTGVY